LKFYQVHGMVQALHLDLLRMQRLFIAIPVPEEIGQALKLVQKHLPQFPGLRWSVTDDFHLTLKFLDEVELLVQLQVQIALRDLVQRMTFAAEDLEMGLTKVGTFQKGDVPRVVWAGVGMSKALFEFQYEIEAFLEPFGFVIEKRRFRPHITLARLRDLDNHFLKEIEKGLANLGVQKRRWKVSEIQLIASHWREDESPEYEVIESFPLQLL
jgi:2'-5' RNA ligase